MCIAPLLANCFAYLNVCQLVAVDDQVHAHLYSSRFYLRTQLAQHMNSPMLRRLLPMGNVAAAFGAV